MTIYIIVSLYIPIKSNNSKLTRSHHNGAVLKCLFVIVWPCPFSFVEKLFPFNFWVSPSLSIPLRRLHQSALPNPLTQKYALHRTECLWYWWGCHCWGRFKYALTHHPNRQAWPSSTKRPVLLTCSYRVESGHSWMLSRCNLPDVHYTR